MRTSSTLACLLLLGCRTTKILIETGDSGHSLDSDTGEPGDTDTDTDTDSDTDADTDTDTMVLPDIRVDCNGGADYTLIQDAIDAATSGDMIAVAPCVYHERLYLYGKTLEIYGTDGSADTIVDGDLGGTLLNVEESESEGTRFAGFTLTGGLDSSGGAAIELSSAVLDLEDVVITGCDDGYTMILSETGFLDMTDVTIVDNDFIDGGAAIISEGGNLTARGLTADCGEDGIYAVYQHNASLITDSTLSCASGYGLYSHHGEMNILRSTITGGVAGIYTEDEEDTPSELQLVTNSAIGGGSVGLDARLVHVEVTNSVLWGTDSALSYTGIDTTSFVVNSVLAGAACGVQGDDGVLSITFSAAWGNTANACAAVFNPVVSADPQFTSFPDDLTLASGSPLVDAGSAGAAYTDLDGTRNDIGRWGGPLGW